MCENGGWNKAAMYESHFTPLWVSCRTQHRHARPILGNTHIHTLKPKGATTFVLDFLSALLVITPWI